MWELLCGELMHAVQVVNCRLRPGHRSRTFDGYAHLHAIELVLSKQSGPSNDGLFSAGLICSAATSSGG
jgi:hypothetical protein